MFIFVVSTLLTLIGSEGDKISSAISSIMIMLLFGLALLAMIKHLKTIMLILAALSIGQLIGITVLLVVMKGPIPTYAIVVAVGQLLFGLIQVTLMIKQAFMIDRGDHE